MTTPADYRSFAHDCLRWADETPDAAQRDTLVGIARLWTLTAFKVEQYVTLVGDDAASEEKLRAKLN